MKLVYLIGAGVLTVTGGMFLAWSIDDRTAQASIEGADTNVVTVAAGDQGLSLIHI